MSSLSLMVFDGFHGRVADSEAIRSLAEVCGVPVLSQRNSRAGPDETLSDRLDRFVTWLDHEPAGHHRSIHVLAYSMGCHVAVRFAGELGPHHRVVGFDLIAPDPKYRTGEMDRIEAARGERSAFDQARELWNGRRPGPAFTAALRAVAATSPCRVVFSRADEVAEWHENAELMRTALAGTDTITWIEAAPGRAVRDNGVTVSVQHGDEIHRSLAERTRFT